MKKIIINSTFSTSIYLNELKESQPIFAKRNGILKGMIIHEDQGWILRLGGTRGSSGWYHTLQECIENDSTYNYDFYVEE